MKPLIKPRRLRVGDTIALIRPASRLDEKAYKDSVKALRNFGFCVAEYPKKRGKDSFFSAPDQDRAQELDWAMREPGIRAVLIARGGYGTQRTLSYISVKQAAGWQPKIVVGYSDPTYFLQWLQNQVHSVSFHGPLTGALPSRAMKSFLKDLLELPTAKDTQTWSEISNIGSKSRGRGRLVGGNLSLLQVSGPAALPKSPIILAIEDVNENYYRIDRMLGVLIDAGYAKYVKGVIVGTFAGCGKDDGKTFGIDRIYERLRKLTRGPIWVGARFGHGLNRSPKPQRILPLGSEVEIVKKEFRILEAVVK